MFDAVIIGAGAAGVGAGLALLREKKSFVILEAKDRVGGRAFSDTNSLGHIWDHGCHWFHSASINPLRKIALKFGHDFIDTPKPYSTRLWHHRGGMELRGFESAYDTLTQRITDADTQDSDLPLASLMDLSSPWNSLLSHDMALTYSQEVENISVADAQAFHDTGENIPVRGGYGNLVACLASALPVRLGTAVLAVEVRPSEVRVQTPQGVWEARQLIMAVPQTVLQRGMIRFSPALPQSIATVFDNLPMGWFEKAGFAFGRPVFGAAAGEGVEIVAKIKGEDWPVAFQLGATPLAIGHVAGHRARDLAEADCMAYCEDALAQCFGADIRKHIVARHSTCWSHDPFIGGAYSCARPGQARLRQLLQEPVHDRIHFAGEHTSLDAMATAHGAYLSGQRAALAALGKTMAEGDPLWLPA
jgi:monoamine oxidase